MPEIEKNELKNEIYKVQEIRPKTDISMLECEEYWNKMFENEIHDDQNESLEENKQEYNENNADLIKTFWNNMFENEIEYAIENNEKNVEQKGLTDEQKEVIKKETGWSDEIVDNVENMDQYEKLKNAGLKEIEINGKICLIKENIDLNYEDEDGLTNRQRMLRGLSPLDSNTGKPLELHHLGQKADSPLVELTEEEHRTGDYKDGKKNQSLWHDNTKETEVHGEGNNWDKERQDHWKVRNDDLKGDAEYVKNYGDN